MERIYEMQKKPKIPTSKKIDPEILFNKIYSLYGNPDDHGFIYIENDSPEQIESTLRKELNNQLTDLALHITICAYEKGSIIKL